MSVKFSSAHYGWICGDKREGGKITEIRWETKGGKASAKPYSEEDAEEMHTYLNGLGIAHCMVRDWVPWFDGGGK